MGEVWKEEVTNWLREWEGSFPQEEDYKCASNFSHFWMVESLQYVSFQ